MTISCCSVFQKWFAMRKSTLLSNGIVFIHNSYLEYSFYFLHWALRSTFSLSLAFLRTSKLETFHVSCRVLRKFLSSPIRVLRMNDRYNKRGTKFYPLWRGLELATPRNDGRHKTILLLKSFTTQTSMLFLL